MISSAQDTFYLGTIKGLWCNYQQAGIDAYGNFGFAKVYQNKKADNAIDFVKTKVQPVYRVFSYSLGSFLTDNKKE